MKKNTKYFETEESIVIYNNALFDLLEKVELENKESKLEVFKVTINEIDYQININAEFVSNAKVLDDKIEFNNNGNIDIKDVKLIGLNRVFRNAETTFEIKELKELYNILEISKNDGLKFLTNNRLTPIYISRKYFNTYMVMSFRNVEFMVFSEHFNQEDALKSLIKHEYNKYTAKKIEVESYINILQKELTIKQ